MRFFDFSLIPAEGKRNLQSVIEFGEKIKVDSQNKTLENLGSFIFFDS